MVRKEKTMTEKLYDKDTHFIHFVAEVTDCSETGRGFLIVLDKTAFFPEEGGQYADRGDIDGQPVLDVHIKGDTIFHLLKNPLPVGKTVTGSVDWEDRFDKMQQHSGEHIVSGLIHKYYGLNNVGFHLGSEEVTLDFNGSLTDTDLERIEQDANEAVFRNIAVRASFPDKETLAKLSYRSKIEIDGPVRIVEIPGYDTCACCAPHVERTGEIGLIKITGLQNYKGGIRLNILCGRRALRDYQSRQETVRALSVRLSAKPALVVDAVSRLEQEITASRERFINLQQVLLQTHISALPEDAENVLLFEADLDTPTVRRSINRLCETHSGYCCIFVGNDTEGYRYMIGSAALDCRRAGALLQEKFAAKGGGSDRMVQGRLLASGREITSALNFPL